MTLGELRRITESLPDDFEIVMNVKLAGNEPFLNIQRIDNISVDIGYSDKDIHFFGDVEDNV